MNYKKFDLFNFCFGIAIGIFFTGIVALLLFNFVPNGNWLLMLFIMIGGLTVYYIQYKWSWNKC